MDTRTMLPLLLLSMFTTAGAAQQERGGGGAGHEVAGVEDYREPAGGIDLMGGTAHPDRYQATIRRTAYGVAHIEAADLASLGFGEGYAQAEDHLCSIADQVVRARGERAKYHGRGEGDAHLISDIAMRALRVQERAVELLAAEPPEIHAWVAGFAAGYNRYLAETGADAVPGWCRAEPWVLPISAGDVAATQRLVTLGSAGAPGLFANGEPPTEAAATGAASASDAAAQAGLALRLPIPPPGASNGWALGREMTESGRGMLLAYPHHSWYGPRRFWEKHLRIPGELDAYGVNLIGGPGVLLGFNRDVAWTLTATHVQGVTMYAIDLVSGQPTRYRFGDEERDMMSREVAIEVRDEPEPVRRTLWSTHHGPVVAGGPFQWTTERAYAWRDANDDNGAFLRHVLAMGRAGSLEAFQAAHTEHQGLPWLKTVAVSADGVAWFADGSARPHLAPAALADWRQRRETDPLTGNLWQAGGIVVLNGSDPAADWVDDPDARRPGIVPFREAPQLERTDYVFNSNDAYWFVHADTVLETGISPMFGEARSPLSPRSRSNVLHLTNATPDRPAGADARFNLREVQEAALGNRSQTADLLVPDLVARSRATPLVALDGEAVDLTEACAILAAWDHRFDLDSRGAVLFREWIGRYELPELRRAGALFAVDFDPGDPVRTPHTLAPGPLALENLARAVRVLEGRGIPLDVRLGEVQFAATKGGRIPIHGSGLWAGILNLNFDEVSGTVSLEPVEQSPRVEGSRFLTEAGYPVLHGTSFLMALEFTDDGPRAEAILTYGQSGDPTSPHFTDQTEMFSRKEWRPVLFRPEDVAAGTLREYTVVGEGPAAGPVADPVGAGMAARLAPHVEPGPCPFEPEPNVLAGIDCGRVKVPENWDAPGGRALEIPVAVVRATAPDARPEALVELRGGRSPGLHYAPAAAAGPMRRDRDVVLFDYRGMGFREPVYGEPLEINPVARSLERMAGYCASEPSCAAAYPDPVGSYRALYD